MRNSTKSSRRGLLALAGAAAVGLGALVVPAGSATAAAGCAVTYTANSWPGGFTANIQVKNLGSDVDGWTLGWTFPDSGQKVTQGWSATYSQSGSAVTAKNASWNGRLASGASTSIGFQGTRTGSNPTPASFTLNGVTCTGTVTTTPPPSTTTPPPSTTTPPPSTT